MTRRTLLFVEQHGTAGGDHRVIVPLATSEAVGRPWQVALVLRSVGRPRIASWPPGFASGGGVCVPYEAGDATEALVQLFNDLAQADATGRRGREYVGAHRSHRRLAADVVSHYRRLINSIRRAGE